MFENIWASAKKQHILVAHWTTLFICKRGYMFCFYLDDLVGPDDDLTNVAVEDDAFDELQAVVRKAMKLKTMKTTNSNEKVRTNERPKDLPSRW